MNYYLIINVCVYVQQINKTLNVRNFFSKLFPHLQ